MNKHEFIEYLKKLDLPRSEYIILSGGSMLMHNLRQTTSDIDLCVSKKLAEDLDLYNAPRDDLGYYVPFDKCQVFDDFDRFEYELVDGFQCETLESVLEFKRRLMRPKDFKDIALLEMYLVNRTS